MRNYPKVLQTKEDYEYVRQNFPKEEWQADFQALLDGQKAWFFVKELADGEIGMSDTTHKIEINNGMDGNKRYQFELRYNPDCKLAQLGYNEDQVKEYLA